MATETKPIMIQGQAVINAAAGDDKPATFDVQVYNGGQLEVPGYDLPVVIDLAGVEFQRNVLANLDHKKHQRVGHVTHKEITADGISMQGVASAATESRREVIESARNGFVWEASIEAMPAKLRQVRRGETIKVNNQTFSGPIYVAAGSKVQGFAFVGNGADHGNEVRIAASAAHGRRRTMKKELKAWIEDDLGLIAAELSDDQVASLEENFEGRNATEPTPAADFGTTLTAIKAEKTRQQEIGRIADAHKDHVDLETLEILGEQAIAEKWDANKFKYALLEASLPVGRSPIGKPPKQRNGFDPDLMELALIAGSDRNLAERLCGNSDKKQELLEQVDKRYPRGIGLRQIMIEAAEANGYRHSGGEVTLDVQRAAFGMQGMQGGPPIHATAFSTFSLPGILSNSAQKFLLEGWAGGDQSWRTVAKVGTARDFKTMTSYRLSGNLTYEKIGGDGEIKHGTLGEDAYTNKADTYGRMFAVTREDIVNDDLRAISQVPFELGIAGIDAFNIAFWTEFLDSALFFTAGNNNIVTPASALSLDGLNDCEQVFFAQTKPNGQPLDVTGQVLLVPPSLWATAQQLMSSMLLISGEDRTQGNNNIYTGKYTAVTNSYLENALYTGNSATAYYLISDPMRYAIIEAVFLNGRQTPIVETADAAFNTLGFQMRGYHDFGVKKQEPRGGVRNAGA